MYGMSSAPVLHFCQVPPTYSKGYSSYRADTKSFSKKKRIRNRFKIKQRVITPKIRKPELSILYVTHHLSLIYISTKYHHYFPKGIQVTERTISFMPTPTGSVPKTICPLHPLGRGGGQIKLPNKQQQEAHGPRFTHLSDIATADMQMLCNIFPILSSQLMKISSFEQFLVLKKNIWA